MFNILLLLLTATRALSLPATTSDAYFSGLQTFLTNSGLTEFSDALSSAKSAANGDVLGELYSDSSFTVYAPIDAAWAAGNSSGIAAAGDLESLLAYHIVPTSLNSSQVAPPRQHTIAATLFRSQSVLLPHNRTQVIVLETAPTSASGSSTNETTILIRGDGWNSTSAGSMINYTNLFIQPIDRVLDVPSPLMETLDAALSLTAVLGATSAITAISTQNLNETFESCFGCTFFIPDNNAFDSVSSAYANLTSDQKTTVLKNHVINGSTLYSPDLSNGDSLISASGMTIAYVTNETGGYVDTGSFAGRILRSDIPVANGVAHLISTVLFSPLAEPDIAASEASANSAAAATATTVVGVLGDASISTSFITTTTTTSTSTSTSTKATSTSISRAEPTKSWENAIKVAGVVLPFVGFWL